MSEPQVPARDEDAVAELPPGEDSPGAVQGGGSDILMDAGSPPPADAGTADVGVLSDLEPEVIEEDKGATGD